MFTNDERSAMIVDLLAGIPFSTVSQLALQLEACGYFKSDATSGILWDITERVEGSDIILRRLKDEYREPFVEAVKVHLAERQELKAESANESAARRKIIEDSFHWVVGSVVHKFYVGLMAGKVPVASVPECLLPWFKITSENECEALPEYKVLLIEVLSKKIAEG